MNITAIRKDDIIFIQTPVGQLPPAKVEERINEIKKDFGEYFDNAMIILGTLDEEYTFEILRKE